MFNYKILKKEKNTIYFQVDIPLKTIENEYQLAFQELQRELVVEGFRKGKVPKKIAEKHLKKEAIYQKLISNLLPKIYQEIIKKEKIQPIINPRIEFVKAKENEDWEIKIIVALRPMVNLKDYKEEIKKIKAEEKKNDIWIPGKENKTTDEKEIERKKEARLNKILEMLLKTVECEISDLIVEEDLNKRLSQLVDDIQKIGLTVESYLRSKNLTYEQLKEQYRQEIINTYKLEFILQAIADAEGVKVEEKDLDSIFALIKDEKERDLARKNAYFYASILRKQKTVDLLLSL